MESSGTKSLKSTSLRRTIRPRSARELACSAIRPFRRHASSRSRDAGRRQSCAARRPRRVRPRSASAGAPRRARSPASGRAGRAIPRRRRPALRSPPAARASASAIRAATARSGPAREAIFPASRWASARQRQPPSAALRIAAPCPASREASARRSQAPSTASRQYESELTRPTALALLAPGERLVDPGLDGLERHAERAPLLEQREVRGREQERGAAPPDERGLGRLVVGPILLGFAHR